MMSSPNVIVGGPLIIDSPDKPRNDKMYNTE